MGAPQNQIIPPSHYSSMQQLLNKVKDSFAAPNSFPSLQIPGHKILLSPRSDPVGEKQLGKIELLCNHHFQIKPLRTRTNFKGGGMLQA